MTMFRVSLALLVALSVPACSRPDAAADQSAAGNSVSLRKLTESEYAVVPQTRNFPLKGQKADTPSDTKSEYYILRTRTAVTGNVIAMLREERDGRVAYARTETDCRHRLVHVLGVGSTRADAEVATANDGPLRSISGLPLREELARSICARSGVPLAPAA